MGPNDNSNRVGVCAGASDDAAGCAVLLEVLRALLARRSPLRRAAVFLFNGAEENIMQASHAFITQHKWAREVRAFINIEACGAGGREVLFQAGPHDPWIMEVYGAVVPHPYASSVAQELFEARLVPGDTDFRIFRDFGNLSGVDLAWSSNGYVYHTALDAAARVPAGSLQRTGDNVLALALGMLNHEAMSLPTARAGPGVFFDVAGLRVLQLAPAAAAAAALALLLLAGVRVHFTARDAHRQLFIRRSEWWWIAARAAARQAAGAGAGLAAAAAAGLALHLFDARLSWYNTPVLVGPLFALPAVLGAWHVALGGAGGRLAAARGWAARAAGDALALQSAAALAACLLLRMRAGFLPAAAVAAAATDILPSIWRFKDGARWAVHFLAWLLPALLAVDLALGSLQMFIPVLGRAGDAAPADVVVALASGALAQGVCASLQPLVLLTRNPQPLMRGLWALSAVSLLLVLSTSLGMPYSPQRPQRLMLFHTRVTEHGRAADTDHLYWLPATDANTYTYLQKYSRLRVRELRELVPMSEEECSARLYCGAPYYLPVRGLLPRALWLPAPEPPAARLAAAPRLARRRRAATLALTLDDNSLTSGIPGAVDLAAAAYSHSTHEESRLGVVRPLPDVLTGAGAVDGTLTSLTLGAYVRLVKVTLRVDSKIVSNPLLAAVTLFDQPPPRRAGARGGGGVAGGGRAGLPLLAARRPPRPAARWGQRHTYFFMLFDAALGHNGTAHWDFTIDLEMEPWLQEEPESWVSLSLAGHALAGARGAGHAALLRALPEWTQPTGWPVDLHLYEL
ncbi:unnamed protein product [Plutella xylostella]|uniref:FXNA-like protease n=1 Tax=Plutella xylostella TaxID=51655 RepID=A0A8S4FIM1_PLUXY|nr:unnamed protein product [Plutella xylostella]